jgi:signal-transduction protein with cAMP-binding, CBS, and nucleotidyltransferase domain
VQSQTVIFSRLVRDFMRAAPLACPPGMPVAELIQRMAAAAASSALVLDGEGRIAGIVTEQDVTRRIAYKVPGEAPVEAVMSRPVLAVPSEEYLYRAVARMRRHGLRHMPVVDGAGRPIGSLDLHDALAATSAQLMRQIDGLTQDSTVPGLKEVKAAQIQLAGELFDDGLPAPEIQGLLTDINRDIYRRIVDLALAEMADQGWGRPPAAFDALIMGSGGRGESFLFPDQDNGFVIADYPDGEHTAIDAFFIELAQRMTRDLDAVGLPLCQGFVMATNPLWRKTLTQWRAQTAQWATRRSEQAVLNADIFFDFQPVWGEGRLARDLRAHVARLARTSREMLQAIAVDEGYHRVALGFFGGLTTERGDAGHRGEINLKHEGTMPLVEAIRLMALAEGVEETATLARIDRLHRKGVLRRDEQDYLVGAFGHIAFLLLRQQLADLRAGKKPGNFVPVEALSERERDILIDSLKAVDLFRKRVRGDLTGQIL